MKYLEAVIVGREKSSREGKKCYAFGNEKDGYSIGLAPIPGWVIKFEKGEVIEVRKNAATEETLEASKGIPVIKTQEAIKTKQQVMEEIKEENAVIKGAVKAKAAKKATAKKAAKKTAKKTAAVKKPAAKKEKVATESKRLVVVFDVPLYNKASKAAGASDLSFNAYIRSLVEADVK